VATRLELMDQELERLREEGRTLEREWRRVPWLSSTVVLAAPTYAIWGPLAALYAVLFVPCLVIAALYLIGVRRSENRATLEELEKERRKLATDRA
jgi:hypothetical protein